MARSARRSDLETRTARLKLAKGDRHFQSFGEGVGIVYRRTADGFGTWTAKLALPGGKYATRALGTADDFLDADARGVKVLTFVQAQAKARALADDARADQGILTKPWTVNQAATDYLAWYRSNRKDVSGTEHAVHVHILPTFGVRQLESLRKPEIKGWLEKLGASPARVRTGKTASKHKYRAAPKTPEERRARQATANRILTVFKALLNRAFEQGRAHDDKAWRRVKPFKKVDSARIRFLTDAEAVRLVNACSPDLRNLVRAALLTGARFGELASLTAQDVNLKTTRGMNPETGKVELLKTGQVYVAESKSGKSRHIPLNPEGVKLFSDLLASTTGDRLVFTKADGMAWGKNHHVRLLAEACVAAKIRPAITFHELRHTYASHLAQAGVDLLHIARLLGHADTRITARHYAHLSDQTLSAAVASLPAFTDAPILQSIKRRRA